MEEKRAFTFFDSSWQDMFEAMPTRQMSADICLYPELITRYAHEFLRQGRDEDFYQALKESRDRLPDVIPRTFLCMTHQSAAMIYVGRMPDSEAKWLLGKMCDFAVRLKNDSTTEMSLNDLEVRQVVERLTSRATETLGDYVKAFESGVLKLD